jgi:hypothetical protein
MKYTVEVDGLYECWTVNGVFHRNDGPARIWQGVYKEWHQHGKLHREDGPAVEYANGEKQWRINGQLLTEEQFNARNAPSNALNNKVVEIEGKKYNLVEV